MHVIRLLTAVLVGGLAGLASCGDDEHGGSGGTGASGGSGSPDQVGASCDTTDDCYLDVDHQTLAGAVQCLDRVRAGYCTHECNDDADCCAVEGECATTLTQVCAPFESTGLNMCFFSCEDGDLVGTTDPQEYCQREASPDFICRSSGGGSQNRKVCVPGDCGVGAACVANTDCAAGLTCNTTISGGVCGGDECLLDVDCPADTLCVKWGTGSFCARTCVGESDCSFCRPGEHAMTCSSTAEFMAVGTTGDVCVPL